MTPSLAPEWIEASSEEGVDVVSDKPLHTSRALFWTKESLRR